MSESRCIPSCPKNPSFDQRRPHAQFDENTITNAVLAARDPRVRRISEALVRHLHAKDHFHLNYDFGLKRAAGNTQAA